MSLVPDVEYRLDNLDTLVQLLVSKGYEVIAPVARDDAILYENIDSAAQLPRGYIDEQEGGHYRLKKTQGENYFDYVVGPDSWKRYLFSREEVLYASTLKDGQLMFSTAKTHAPKRAFFGMRSCELHAIGVQDRVFVESDYSDPRYVQRRVQALFIAVNCTRSAATCFCASLDTGPRARQGFDLSLTEVNEKTGEHFFLLQAGSSTGEELIQALKLSKAASAESDAADQAIARAAQQSRAIDTRELKENIYANMENQAFWDDIASRCLNCANCTMVCPTCFCSTVETHTDLAGENTEQVRHWDSCFNVSHSHIAGGSVRVSNFSRYRQWFSHKLASWQDQFGTLGCTGCGRCITWCPVGIDITAEAKRLQAGVEG